MSAKKSKKSVFVTWMKYIVGIPVFGVCFLLLLSSVKLDLFIPFKEELLGTMDIYLEGSTLYNLVEMERSAGFLKFVVLRAVAIPSILFLGLNAVGMVIITIKKLVGGKRGFNIAVWIIIAAAFLLETISIIKVIWKGGSVLNNVWQSFLCLLVLGEIFLFAFSPFLFSLSEEDESKDYLSFIGGLLLLLYGFLAVEFLFAYWKWSVLSTIMQLLLFLGVLAFPFLLLGGIFYDEEKASSSSSYSSNYGSHSDYSYGNSYNSYGSSSQSTPQKRNIYSHYETKVDYSITKTYDNGTHDIDYDATFYFKNDDGDVETKSACGRFDGITSSYISAGDVEYRHGYMLGDYEK